MPIDRVEVLGAGGHAAVVIDALLAAGLTLDQIGVWTQAPVDLGQHVLGIPIRHLGRLDELEGTRFHVAIGDNRTRARLYAALVALNALPVAICHPAAVVSSHAVIGDGCFLAARAIIAPRADVGAGVIINHAAVVDHDCEIGDFAHVAPGATLGGASQLGDMVLVGAGANILPSRRVGRGTTIGAGGVVLHDTEENVVYAGVPAAPLPKRIL